MPPSTNSSVPVTKLEASLGRKTTALPISRRTATTDWLAPFEEGMCSLGRPELATLVLAVIRGLLKDLDATGDTARTDRAFHDFLATLDGS
jgi:hypothetical protein